MRKGMLSAVLTTAGMLAPTVVIATATAVLPAEAAAQERSAVVGDWTGVLPPPAGLTLVFHITATDGGGLTGTLDSPDQGANGIPIDTVRFANDTLTVRINALGVVFKAALAEDGSKLTGQFMQGGYTFPLELTKGEPPERTPRPQEPAGRLPYDTEDVTFRNTEANITLAGTLTLPRSPGPHPAAVLVSGSGAQDRDEALMGHKPFLVLADHLTRNGIAVLRYDDRGFGESGGQFATATTSDFATDALAATRYLRSRPGVNPDAVGIIGHSEGGLVAPAVAAESSAVAYIVMLAGPGVPGEEILNEQIAKISRASGASEDDIARALRTQSRIYEVLRQDLDDATARRRLRAIFRAAVDSASAAQRAQMGSSEEQIDAYINTQINQITSPWFRNFLRYDPRPALEKVTVPVLALNGSLDLQVVPEQNLPEIEAALKRAGNDDVTARRLPGLNHLFQNAMTGSPAEYATIQETFSPAALDIISSWIVSRFR